MSANLQQLSNFIWSVADLLRGPYRPPQYERVMLPLTVLRRFDAVLAPTKDAVLARFEGLKGKEAALVDRVLNEMAKDDDGRSSLKRRSKSSKRPTASTRSSPNSPRSTCTRIGWTASPWAWCSKT
jgi:type I restriction-modification system DNA methylase subunit